MTNDEHPNLIVRIIERFIFSSRWLLVILYTLLNVGLALYTFKFIEELWEMLRQIRTLNTEMAMLSLLSLVDITMVANLVVMVNVGGYSIFIREIDPRKFANKPRFMKNITSSGLKTKMGSSLVGVSSIHLLKLFIQAASASDGHGGGEAPTWLHLSMALAIHLTFVVSTLVLAVIENSHHGSDADNHAEKHAETEKKEEQPQGSAVGTEKKEKQIHA